LVHWHGSHHYCTADWKGTNGLCLSAAAWVESVRLGTVPLNIQAMFFGNAVRPTGGSPWGMRLQVALLFPKKPG